jgi:tripartite-type tricarboxylate transporter receptor subunit TctC
MKTPHRRQFLRLAAGAAAMPALSRIAWAQAYPTRPVRLVVGYPAGGSPDIVARLIGQRLQERLSQPFVIENRPGVNANIGTEAVVRAPSDGYALLLATTANVINTALYDKLNFNFIRDIVPVATIMSVPLALVVHPSVPANTVPEFIAYAKANPGKLNMASPGIGNLGHVIGELFKMIAGVDIVHVPYRGSALVLPDLIGGQVQLTFAGIPSSIEYIKAGKARALAVTGATRSEVLPDVPTVGDFLPGFEATTWYGMVAPKNTPAEIVGKLNREINAIIVDAKIGSQLADLGGSILPGSPVDFGKLLVDETERWGKIVKFAGIKLD